MINNFLRGNSAADQIRSQLALSAAQRIAGLDANRFQQQAPQEQIQRPSFLDFAPEIAGNVSSRMAERNIQNEQMQREQEERMRVQEQVAQALAERYKLPIDRAMQIASLPEARQKEAIASLDREMQTEQKTKIQERLAQTAFERQKQLAQFKADLKGNDTIPAKDKRLYDQGINIAKALEKYKNAAYAPFYGNLGGLTNRDKEDQVRPLITKLAGLEGKLFGMSDKQKNSVIDSYLREFYDSPESRAQLFEKIQNDMNPGNLQAISEGFSKLNAPQEEMQQEIAPQQGGGVLGEIGKKAAHLASGVASNLGRLGDIQQAASGPIGGAGHGLPADYLANLENMDPELIKQIEAQRAQETPEQQAQVPERPGQLPTSESIREGIKSLLPEGFLDNPDVVDAALDTVGQDLPLLALAGVAGGTQALWQPLARSVLSGATVDVIKKSGGGPLAQFMGSVAAGMAVDKGFRSVAEGFPPVSRQASDLNKVVDGMYNEARAKGGKTNLSVSPFAKKHQALGNKVFGESPFGKADTEDLKHIITTFQPIAKSEKISLERLIETQVNLNEQIKDLSSKKAIKAASELNKGLNEILALAPTAPGVKEYNIGKNIFKAVNTQNKLEKLLYQLGNTKTRAGVGLAGTYLAGLLGFKKVPLVAGATAGVLAGSSAYRQISNLAKLPQARKAALDAIKELYSGNDVKGLRNLNNLVKIATVQARKSKD